jgi:hypothetical protein
MRVAIPPWRRAQLKHGDNFTSSLQVFRLKFCMPFDHPLAGYMPLPSRLIMWWGVHIMKLFLVQFSVSCHCLNDVYKKQSFVLICPAACLWHMLTYLLSYYYASSYLLLHFHIRASYLGFSWFGHLYDSEARTVLARVMLISRLHILSRTCIFLFILLIDTIPAFPNFGEVCHRLALLFM